METAAIAGLAAGAYILMGTVVAVVLMKNAAVREAIGEAPLLVGFLALFWPATAYMALLVGFLHLWGSVVRRASGGR